jgi:N-acetylneuraminate synthase
MKDIFIVAEIGINHNGSIEIAEKLIRMAKKTGCDAVKFQKRTIEVVYSKKELDQDRESPWGNKFIDQKRGLEFVDKEYEIINNICKSLQIEWFASAWDIESLNFLKKFNNKYNKVASAMITHIPFLEEIAKQKKYTFISTGMSDYTIIDKAVEIFKKYKCPFELMHSVSVYPCPENLLNLQLIKKLQERYNCKVGYSGHEASVSPSIYAVALGATSIERHITLDRSMYGSDQSASLEEVGLSQLVGIVRKFKILYGNSEKQILPEEINIIKKLRYWENK